jgi:hypothetical protein
VKDVRDNSEKGRATLVGIGLDGKDGHVRMTTGENFRLVGGSEETHDRMIETTMKFNESVKKRGKTLDELERQEFRDLMDEATDS